MKELSPKPLKYKSLPGLSEKQLSEHHDVLYAGYVKKVNEIRTKMKSVKYDEANATFSDLRELKVEETFALNGVRLHEWYFDNMTAEGNKPSGTITKMLTRDFGSLEAWATEFAAMGIAARGWVVLGYDMESGELLNVLCDLHNQGGVWGVVPLLVLDVYEHAYFLDYATARKKYIEQFMANINWSEVNERLEKFIK